MQQATSSTVKQRLAQAHQQEYLSVDSQHALLTCSTPEVLNLKVVLVPVRLIPFPRQVLISEVTTKDMPKVGQADRTVDVDAWIDHLDENLRTTIPNAGVNPMAPDIAVAFLVQQNLPRMQLPTFDG